MTKAFKNHPVFGIAEKDLPEKLAMVAASHLADAFNRAHDPDDPTPETHSRALRREVNRRIGAGTLG